jgi:hypothetical protein
METQVNTSKTLALVKIYNNWGLMKIKANFENIKVKYYEMVKVLKTTFSNMIFLIIKIDIINHSESFNLELSVNIIIL